MRKGAVKNFHKQVVKIWKSMNDNICKDDVWLGRFEIREKQQFYKMFDDGSGYQAWYVVEAIDKKTGRSARKVLDTYFGVNTHDEEDKTLNRDNKISLRFFSNKLWEFVNNFIIEDCQVWQEQPSPYDNRVDYRPKKNKAKYVVKNGILSNI